MISDRLTIRIVCEPVPRTPLMLQTSVACSRAQARLDALSKRPADIAWFEVMDALWVWVSEVPATPGA
jgi:hypothetical protein